MSANDLRRLPTLPVALFYNAMLATGFIPPAIKICRTTLIPKGDLDPANINSWRPITVTNILLRSLHQLVSRRLYLLPLHFSQRGFKSLDGTMANSVLLHSTIRTCRQLAKPYSVVFLDLKKAFDTVPHASIERALRRFNIDPRLSKFLMSGLTGCSTTVSVASITSEPINILRGCQAGRSALPATIQFGTRRADVSLRYDVLGLGIKRCPRRRFGLRR